MTPTSKRKQKRLSGLSTASFFVVLISLILFSGVLVVFATSGLYISEIVWQKDFEDYATSTLDSDFRWDGDSRFTITTTEAFSGDQTIHFDRGPTASGKIDYVGPEMASRHSSADPGIFSYRYAVKFQQTEITNAWVRIDPNLGSPFMGGVARWEDTLANFWSVGVSLVDCETGEITGSQMGLPASTQVASSVWEDWIIGETFIDTEKKIVWWRAYTGSGNLIYDSSDNDGCWWRGESNGEKLDWGFGNLYNIRAGGSAGLEILIDDIIFTDTDFLPMPDRPDYPSFYWDEYYSENSDPEFATSTISVGRIGTFLGRIFSTIRHLIDTFSDTINTETARTYGEDSGNFVPRARGAINDIEGTFFGNLPIAFMVVLFLVIQITIVIIHVIKKLLELIPFI